VNFSTGAIALVAKGDAVSSATVSLEFKVDHDTQVTLPSLLINEDLYQADLIIPLPSDEMPPLVLETRLPQIEKEQE